MRRDCWVVAIAVLLGTLGLLPGAVALGSTITVQPGESIQAAIDEAPEGGVVWLAVGEWEEDIVIRKNLTLRGEGPDNSVIRVTEAGAGATVIIAPTGADPVWVVMTDLAVHGKANAAGIAAMRTAQLAISDCTISGSEFGLMLIDSAQLTMSGCTLRDNLLAGIALWDQAQGTITDCTISGSPSGIALGDAAKATVEDNRVIDNEVGVLLIDDTAEVSGSGNLIPGPGEADGNTLAAFDPADLGFLVEPRVDPAPPTAQPGWRGVRAGDLCLTVPEDWSDFTEEFRRDVGELDSDEGEILAAWEGDAIESRVAIMRVSSEGREELKSLPEEDGGKLIVEGPYDLAGRPGGQLLFSFPDVNGEGRGWLVWQEAPGPGGFYLMVMAYYWAKDEPVLQETLASIGVCEDVATVPDVPISPEVPDDVQHDSFELVSEGGVGRANIGAGHRYARSFTPLVIIDTIHAMGGALPLRDSPDVLAAFSGRFSGPVPAPDPINVVELTVERFDIGGRLTTDDFSNHGEVVGKGNLSMAFNVELTRVFVNEEYVENITYRLDSAFDIVTDRAWFPLDENVVVIKLEAVPVVAEGTEDVAGDKGPERREVSEQYTISTEVFFRVDAGRTIEEGTRPVVDAPTAGTADEAAQRLERALRAGDADAVVALFHPEIRDAAREGYEEALAELGEATVREELRLVGEGFSDRSIWSQDESRVVYEFPTYYGSERMEFRLLDGNWWLWD